MRMRGANDAIFVDVAVIGAGPAGLAAAACAKASGIQNVMALERQAFVGGVLPQCIHDGFGLHVGSRSLTGPEYAEQWDRIARDLGAEIFCDTTVLSVERAGEKSQGFELDVVGLPFCGRRRIWAKSVIVASGCRERNRGQMKIAGTRPAGVMTAGCAQYMINVRNQLPGDKAVILGTGDIGLIMARRLKLEGAEVRMVVGAEATGLLRNYIRCVEDFSIPLRLGWGVCSIHGKGRLKGVSVAPINKDGSFDLSKKEYIRCNLLLSACGLIPEREVIAGLGDKEGLFLCGNAEHPHDVVDQVTQDGLAAGLKAATFVKGAAPGELKSILPDRLREILDMHIAESKAVSRFAVQSSHPNCSNEGSDTFDVCDSGIDDEKLKARDAGFVDAKVVVCSVCPKGCVMTFDDKGVLFGNGCERGVAFALSEIDNPKRMFTGTVKLSVLNDMPLLPVRTDDEVPRSSLLDIARMCRRITVNAPVSVGDVIVSDVAGTGVDLIASASVCAPDCAKEPVGYACGVGNGFGDGL